ncbi:MAG: nuclear transport factor 2 family protein [Thermoanaerobaculia bacterium]
MKALCLVLFLTAPLSPQTQVSAVLDDWHAAAAAADERRYFSHFAPDAVFLGTDATERWTRDEFRQWARPHFASRKTWSFRAVSRHISLSPDGNVAWFDEDLETSDLGPARGSGVLLRQKGEWKIAHYDLSIPIPNPLMEEFRKRIEEFSKKRRGPRVRS